MSNIFNFADTWNSGAVFTAIKLNTTDSGPSDAESLLMDLQVGGASKFKVRKDGRVTVANYFDSLSHGLLVGTGVELIANNGGVIVNRASSAKFGWANVNCNIGFDAYFISPAAGHIATPDSFSVMNATAIPAGGTAAAGYKFSSTANFGVFFGSGAPSLTAAKGSLYLRSDGSGIADRLYVNTDGSTAWTAVATAS